MQNGIISFSILPVVLLTTILFRNIARKNYRKIRRVISSVNVFLSENISGMKILHIFNLQKKKYKEFEKISNELKKSYIKEIALFGVFRPLMYIFYSLSLTLIIYFGGVGVIRGTISFGLLFVFIYYIRLLFDPIQELAEQFNILQSAMASSEKIFEILDTKNEIKIADNPIKLDNLKGEIVFKNVWFAYNDDDWILKDISFKISSGESVAFVGATGSGKTTIINLLCRYYDIQKGEILLDGINIKNIDISSLRKNIGQVMQDVFLFTGTIRDNIRLNDESITDSDIKKAVEFVNARYFIENLNNKYDTYVSERGQTFSTGERQLLSFARAISYKPNLLVLDEATSNIDTETEKLIQDALIKMVSGKTSIIIAHRLSTIQHCNKIIVIHKGTIKEVGNHQQLLQKKGIYYNLYKLNYSC